MCVLRLKVRTCSYIKTFLEAYKIKLKLIRAKAEKTVDHHESVTGPKKKENRKPREND